MEEKAGIKAFEKFSYYNTVNALAKGDISKWGEIMNMPYSLVLTKLRIDKEQAAYEKRYTKLLEKSKD